MFLTPGDSGLTAGDIDAAPGFGFPVRVRGLVITVTSVRAQLDAFRCLGLDRATLLAQAQVGEAELADPGGAVSAAHVYRIWEAAEAAWSRPGLGLHAGAHVPLGAYEVLDYVLACGETLRDGMREFARFFALATRTATYELEEDGDPVRCVMRWRVPVSGVMFHLRDYSLSALSRRVREAGGGPPAAVELQGVPLAGAEEYARVLGAPVALGASANALLYARGAWESPLTRGDARLQGTLRAHAELLLERLSATAVEDVAQRVRAHLLTHLRVGLPSLAQVARTLAVGERTLQRQLREQGTSFDAITDEVRQALARQYLGDPALGVGEIAYLLGYSEPSAFTRAFRRWTGTSPAAFRSRSS